MNLIRSFLLLGLLLLAASLQAQTARTIQEIRQVVDLLTDDRSVLHGEQVLVEGVVVTDPNDWYQAAEATRRYSFWIQEAGESGSERGLQIRLNSGTPENTEATGILNLRKGMRVRLAGEVAYFRGEVQINLATDRPIEVLEENFPLVDRPVFIGSSIFTDLLGEAQLVTATEWEGTYLTIRNLRVINVNTNASRGNFTVEDELGNTIVIWDAHKDMRTGQNGWQKPELEDRFLSISGILYHRVGGNPPQLPGTYELHPYSPEDLVREAVPQSYMITTSSFQVCAGGTVELSVVTESGDPLPRGTTVTWQPADLVVDSEASSTYTLPLSETTVFAATIDDGIDAYLETIEIAVVPNRLRLDVFEQPGAINGRKQIVLVGRGGQRPYEYSINGGQDFRTVSRFQGLSAGTFQLILLDSNGCTLERSLELR